MKLSLLSLFLVAAVVCVSVSHSAPAPHWPRFRERRLRNRPAETKAEEEVKTEEKVESAGPEGKKEEKKAEGGAAFDFGTLPVEEAKKEDVAVVVAAPKKAAKVEEAEDAEEAEGLSIEV